MKVKICGITNELDTTYINEADVDYAGFVFFEPSKRNVTIETAKYLLNKLDKKIVSVAVTVSPDMELVSKIEGAGLKILQVHKELSLEVLNKVKIPIWYAVNLKCEESVINANAFLDSLPGNLRNKIKGILIDAPGYGSGETFKWEMTDELIKLRKKAPLLILAGGLTGENVLEGIRIFNPDIVDVSSSVEGVKGKDREKILKFVERARGKGNE